MKPIALAVLAALAAAPAAYAAAAAPSVDKTPLADLLANPATKPIVDKYLPGLAAHPNYGMVKGMTVKQLSAFPQAQLTPEKVAAMQAEFAKLK
ncbi:MAG: hypothetical protein IT546_07245 [Caulobacteraceae bacterium]|nr:hypothetical protein [Caulobacteraceae bacterium]